LPPLKIGFSNPSFCGIPIADTWRAGGTMNKKLFSIVALLLLAIGTFAEAQQAGKIPHIGFLDSSTASGMAVLVETFRQELSKLGWIEGKNITIEYRFADQKFERT
jgi:putative ABC transport system substrate-binding protein